MTFAIISLLQHKTNGYIVLRNSFVGTIVASEDTDYPVGTSAMFDWTQFEKLEDDHSVVINNTLLDALSERGIPQSLRA